MENWGRANGDISGHGNQDCKADYLPTMGREALRDLQIENLGIQVRTGSVTKKFYRFFVDQQNIQSIDFRNYVKLKFTFLHGTFIKYFPFQIVQGKGIRQYFLAKYI